MKDFSDFGIDTKGKSGEIKTLCPKCSADRKKKKYPCLNVNTELGVWHCWHCDYSGTLKGGEDRSMPISRPKIYTRPKVQKNPVSETIISYLQGRGITKAVLDRNKIFEELVYMPQIEAESKCIAFPYYRNNELINVKYRDKDKNFRSFGGAERILYGMDDIENDYLIWVEGEIDKLSVEVAGLKSCVSVPDGAPAANTKDFSKKFEYLEGAEIVLKNVKKHILAVDNDAPGKTLEAELVRRLSPEKCYQVYWPEGCKDANETLMKHGADILRSCIDCARPYPIEGLFTAEDCYPDLLATYQNGYQRGLSTGFLAVDHLYTVRPGEWTVITGIPGSGKSEWLDAVMVNMAMEHGWKFAVCSPENQPIKEHVIKLAEKVINKPFLAGRNNRMSTLELEQAVAWINEHFFFILPERITLKNIMDLCRVQIERKGVNALIVDPWNEVEAEKPGNVTETDYISKSLSEIRKFTRKYMIHTWIVAHPTKLQKDQKTNKYNVPTPYDISGSAHWRNKADNAIAVHRNIPSVEAEIHIQKIRFKIVGRVGLAKLNYEIATGVYS